jgi:flagellar biogenesis protein FliO
MTPLGRYIVETVVTLLLVSGLALVVLYAAKRGGMGRPSGPLRLMGRLVLDARRAIYLVRVGETVYVVGASEAGLTKLGELARDALPDLPDRGETPPRAFSEFLQRLAPKREREDSSQGATETTEVPRAP